MTYKLVFLVYYHTQITDTSIDDKTLACDNIIGFFAMKEMRPWIPHTADMHKSTSTVRESKSTKHKQLNFSKCTKHANDWYVN